MIEFVHPTKHQSDVPSSLCNRISILQNAHFDFVAKSEHRNMKYIFINIIGISMQQHIKKYIQCTHPNTHYDNIINSAYSSIFIFFSISFSISFLYDVLCAAWYRSNGTQLFAWNSRWMSGRFVDTHLFMHLCSSYEKMLLQR